MNATIDTIHSRRSVRKYTGEQVPEELLTAVLEAGRRAPSGGNTQTCHFMVIQNADVLSRLKELATAAFAAMEAAEDTYKSLANAIRHAKRGDYDFTFGAPTLVVVSNLRSYPNAMASSACALQNMMLAATSLGLGSCWINQLHWLDADPGVRACLEALGLGADETICGSLALGLSAVGEQKPTPITGNRVTYLR